MTSMRSATGALLLTAFLAFSGTACAQSATASQIAERTVQRRAIEAANWGMPVVNFDRMVQAMLAAKGSFNQVVYWSGFSDWKNQTLTPNPDTVYFKPFIDLRSAGPMVLEIPPAGDAGSITGTIMDSWQAALEDVGPAGVDKGQGGKYLIVPPGYRETTLDGYIVLPSQTFLGFALLRSIVKSGSVADIASAVDYGKRIKLYPLSQATDPPPTVFVDMIDVVFDSTIPYDERFYQSLHRMVQIEPWLPRDKAMIDILRSIGIEKGKPFAPDAKTAVLLNAALQETHAWLNVRYETVFPPFYDGGQWFLPATEDLREAASTFYETPNSYPIDARGLTDYWAFTTVKHLGTGQFYLMSIRDKVGAALDGGADYRLTVPANAPARQYWSIVVYDRATHALVRNSSRLSRSSQNADLLKNADGSVDIFFGPKAPAGKESNWIATTPGGRFEVLFRIYGPDKALFDKSWKLPDIESASPAAAAVVQAPAVAPESGTVPVTVDNFIRAESDLYFSAVALKENGFGKFEHHRELAPIDAQTVIRMNRDTLYSAAVFDLDAGPVTITLPDSGKRFMSIQVISQDEYTLPAIYKPGRHVLTKKQVGTRYVLVGVRTLVNPSEPDDIQKVHALQDGLAASQSGGPGKFEVPKWDPVSQKKVRDALIVLGTTLTDTSRSFGTKEQVDPIQRLVSAATTWGGNPRKDAIYLNFTPTKNDGNTLYHLRIGDVPVDGFWSISLYNADGYFQKNDLNAYSLNNLTSKRGADGSVLIQFGGCDGKILNCLPIAKGWSYTVRLYRARAEILSGKWNFPEPRPVK